MVNCHDYIGINGIAPTYTAKCFCYKLYVVTLNLFFASGFLGQRVFLALSGIVRVLLFNFESFLEWMKYMTLHINTGLTQVISR